MENVCKCTALKSEFTERSENRDCTVQKEKTVLFLLNYAKLFLRYIKGHLSSLGNKAFKSVKGISETRQQFLLNESTEHWLLAKKKRYLNLPINLFPCVLSLQFNELISLVFEKVINFNLILHVVLASSR